MDNLSSHFTGEETGASIYCILNINFLPMISFCILETESSEIRYYFFLRNRFDFINLG